MGTARLEVSSNFKTSQGRSSQKHLYRPLTPVLEQDDEELGLMQVFASHIPVSQLTRPRESRSASAS